MKIATIGAAIATAATAKSITDTEGRKAHNVQLSVSNEDLYIFKNFDDYWKISATPPMTKIGWNWTQTYTSTPSTETPVINYYQVELQPFVQAQANLISTLFI